MVRRSVYRANESLDADSAWRVLSAYWDSVVGRFASEGYDQPSLVKKVRVDPKWHDTCRHYAGASHDCKTLVVAPELAELPVRSILGILAHEGGHFVDLSSPGRYWFRQLRAVNPRQGAAVLAMGRSAGDGKLLWFFEELPEKNLRKHMAEWKERDDDEVEFVADAIAESVMGTKIGYVGHPACLVQSLGKGIDRPTGLR